jgi:hypothetical protein
VSVILSTQDGLVCHDQLAPAGITRAMLRQRLGTGRWRRVLPSVYASFNGYLTPRQRWLAALLYAGAGATLTGRVALGLYGVRSAPSDPYVRVLVPHVRQVPSVDFVRVHRTRRPDPNASTAGLIRACSPTRAVADACRWSRDLGAIRVLVDEVLRSGLVSMDDLDHEVRGGPTGGSALLRLALAERRL